MTAQFKPLLLLLLSLGSMGLVSCANDHTVYRSEEDPNGVTQSSNLSGLTYSNFLWETTGGGDLKYAITPSGNSFSMNVTRKNFVPKTCNIIINSSGANVGLYSSILSIFQGTVSVTPGVSGASGTYKKISLYYQNNGNSFLVNEPVLNNNPSDPTFSNLSAHASNNCP